MILIKFPLKLQKLKIGFYIKANKSLFPLFISPSSLPFTIQFVSKIFFHQQGKKIFCWYEIRIRFE